MKEFLEKSLRQQVTIMEDKELYKILYLIFDYPHKHYTFKYFEV